MSLRDEWLWRIRIALKEKNLVLETATEETKSVHILRVSKRLIDDGNVPSGAKYLLDALVKERLLRDDSRKWARVTFDQRKARSDEGDHMEITIAPVSQANPEYQL